MVGNEDTNYLKTSFCKEIKETSGYHYMMRVVGNLCYLHGDKKR
jgi:hypothetical protein